MRTTLRLAIAAVCVSTSPVLVAWAQQSSAPAHQEHQHEHGTQAPDHLEHHFDDPEQLARSFDDPARDEWQMPSRVIDALHINPGDAVADIGAGTGYFSVRLARLAAKPKVYAVDVEPSMIEYLRARAAREQLPNVVPVLTPPDRASLPEPVDVVLIVDTYHHIGERVAYFTRLKSSLKPGGRVAIVDFRKDAPSGPPVEFRFTPDQIRGEMEQAGYTLASQHDFLPRQNFLIFTAK